MPTPAITLAASANPWYANEDETYTATVTGLAGPATNDGVYFCLETNPCQLNGPGFFGNGFLAKGVATMVAGAQFPIGSDHVVVTFPGDHLNGPATTELTETVLAQTATTTAVSLSPNPAAAGQVVTIRATVAATAASVAGDVVYFCLGPHNPCRLQDGAAQRTLNSAGVARFTTTALPVGTTVVVATYAGHGPNASSSASASEVVHGGRTAVWTGLGATPNWSEPMNWNPQVAPTTGESLTFPSYANSPIASTVDDIPQLSINTLTIDDGYDFTAINAIALTITGTVDFNLELGQHPAKPAPFAIPISSRTPTLTLLSSCSGCPYPFGTTITDAGGTVSVNADLELVSGGISARSVSVVNCMLMIDNGASLGSASVQVLGGGDLVVGANSVLPNSINVSQGDSGGAEVDLQAGSTVSGAIVFSSGFDLLRVADKSSVTGGMSGPASVQILATLAGGTFSLGGATRLTAGLQFANYNNFTPPFVVSVAQPSSLGTGLVTVTNADLRLGFNTDATLANPIRLSGGLHLLNPVALTLSGSVQSSGGATVGAAAPAGSISFAGGMSGSPPNIDGSGTVVMRSAITAVPQGASSTVAAPADLVINTPPGAVGWAGWLTLAGTGSRLQMAPGTDAALQLGALTIDGGTVDIGDTAQMVGSAPTLTGGTITGAGSLTVPGISDVNSAAGTSLVSVGSLVLTGSQPYIETTMDNLAITSTIDGTGGVYVLTPASGRGGVVTFTANNAYTGQTQVGGVLVVDGTQPQSPVWVSSVGTLTGSGSIGPVTSAGGAVIPSGSLRVAGATFDSQAAVGSYLGGTTPGTDYGQLVATAPVNLANANLELGFGYSLQGGDSFTVIANQSGQAIQGTFSSLPEGSTFDIGGYTMRITYHGGASGNDVVLTTVASPQVLTLDEFGGLHNAVGSSISTTGAPYWSGRALARGVAVRGTADGGYELDAYGGVHNFGNAPQENGSAYWNGWDIARGIAVRPDGKSGFVLDGFGQLHPFGNAPTPAITGYWNGWDIARAVTIDPCDPTGNSGYVLDGWGGVHPFGGAPNVTATWSSPGHDLAHSLIAECDGGVVLGWVLDGYGGVHTFVDANYQPPADPPIAAHWTSDVARAIVLTGLEQGYVVDAYGGLNSFGGAASLQPGGYWPGWAVVRGAAAP